MLEIWAQGCEFCSLASQLTQCPVPFCLSFVLAVSQFAQDFWEPQNCWFLPFAAQVSQLFFATLDFGVFMAML